MLLSFTTNICVRVYTSQTALDLMIALDLMFWSALRYPVWQRLRASCKQDNRSCGDACEAAVLANVYL